LTIALQIVEEIVEPGEALPEPAPEPPGPLEYGPCPNCQRLHRPMVVAIEGD
jgi:hypothetical protein